MPGEELNPNHIDDLTREREHALDERIVSSLESQPDLSASIPADFAARVAAQVPARPPVAVATTHYGRTAMWVSVAVLLVVLVFVSTNGLGRSVMGAVIEWLLFAQFLAFVIWVAMQRLREG